MMKRADYTSALFAAFMLAFIPGCDVHEFPDAVETAVEQSLVAFRLKLDFSTDMPLYTEVQYSSRSVVTTYQARYIVNIYEPESDGSYGRTYSEQHIFTGTDADSLDMTVTIDLEEGDYKFMVWTDYVPEGSTDDWYYDTSNFAGIEITDNYEGATDYRDAFRGSVTAEVTVDCDSAVVEMSRPMAKYEFISEDLDEFIEKAIAKAMASENAGSTDGSELSYDDIARSINLADYFVMFAYTSYMPCSYNLFTDRPADSATGMYYYGALSQLSDTEAELGFDYVFVNGNATSVQVALYVYDKYSELIASSDVITVPLMRSQLTVVRGDFLTSEASGGVGIVPDYDGDYNIELE